MPTTTQLASLVVSAFDTFLIVHNSRQLIVVYQPSCSMSTGNHSLTIHGGTITSYIWVPTTTPRYTFACSSCSEEKSPMVRFPDPQQFYKQLWEWHVIAFCDQLGETFEQLQHYSHIWKPWVHLPHPYILTYPLGASPKQKRSWSLSLESESIIFIILSRVKTITMLCIFI